MMASSSFSWKKAMENDLDAPLLGRNDPAVDVVRLASGSQDIGYIGAVYIDIQDPDAGAFLGQSDCQVYGHGGLADAALAAVDANLRLDFVQALTNLPLLLPASLDLFKARVLRVLRVLLGS